MKEYNFDNINEFFEDLMNKPNAKLHMLTVYSVYERECERVKQQQEIESQYNHDRSGYNYIAHILTDDIAIVEQQEKGTTKGYYAHVNGQKTFDFAETFEQALLKAISIKITGEADAGWWMWRLLKE